MAPPIVPVILSGGSGTRLWPLSRAMRPKQFIDLVGQKSLFQRTLLRVQQIDNITDPIIVCNEEHRFMVAEQMQELGVDHNAIILEPDGKNTAPAIAAAALKLSEFDNLKDAVMLVLPADHMVADVAAFKASIEISIDQAQENRIVTLGIVPDKPATGFGYLETESAANGLSAVAVKQFIEKPSLADAQSYLKSGNYYWNSGVFVMSATTFLDELAQFEPEICTHVREAVMKGKEDLDFFRLDGNSYKKSPNISVDYAVMEKSQNLSMVQMDATWSDIGSWSSLWEVGDKDAQGNVSKGDVWLESVSNSYIHAENKLVSAIGMDDVIIVETHDGVMVTSKDHDREIKQLVERLKQAGRPEVSLHRKAFRPWGNYDCLDNGQRFQVKRIMVKPGQCTSMQKHFHRAEHWIVVSGTAEVTCGDKVSILTENEAAYIPLGSQHRLKNPGTVPLELIEVQTGAYLGEDDIERIDDEYGRA